jgi:sulfite reductase alpha subunit-like flavoprotein
MHPNTIHLTVGLVKYKTNMKSPRIGVCSKYVESLKPGGTSLHSLDLKQYLLIGYGVDYISGRIVRGTMVLPASPETPCLFIAAGTGIAPMRSLIQERVHASTSGKPPPVIILTNSNGLVFNFYF